MKIQLPRPAWASLVAAVFLNCLFSASVNAQATIYPFGYNVSQQLELTPSTPGFLQVAVGLQHSVGLREGGFIETWGGSGGAVHNNPTGAGFTQVAAGERHSLALRTDGSIISWGHDNTGVISGTPIGAGFTQIVAGRHHSIALHSDGSLVAWGISSGISVDLGQVTDAPAGVGFSRVEAGDLHSLALKTDGSIVSWGGTNGLLIGSPNGTGFIDITGGTHHSGALRADGSIVIWGSQQYGPLLFNFPTEPGFSQFVIGGKRGLALRADGTIATWGEIAGPIPGAPMGSNFTSLAGGQHVYYGLREANPGNAYCFGDGSGAACPCGTNGLAGQGCPHGGGNQGATLSPTGNAFILDGGLKFHVTGMTSNKVGLILRGRNQVNGGLGVVAGNGLLCTGGQIARSQLVLSDPLGNMTFHIFNGDTFARTNYGPGITATYQLWYRDPIGGCSGTGFNFSNAWTLPWVL